MRPWRDDTKVSEYVFGGELRSGCYDRYTRAGTASWQSVSSRT